MNRFTSQKKENGFSIIEALVAASLFGFVVSAILGVYMSVLRLDTRTRAQRAVTDNARLIMEFLAKEVRDGRINYAAGECSGVVTDPLHLCLVNQNNEAVHIYAESSNLTAGTNLMLQKAQGTTSLNSSNVRLTKLKFMVAPTTNPFTPAKNANEQPRVTVILELTSTSARDPVKVNLQSTLSSNYYPPR